MKKTKAILLVVLLSCIAFIAVMCMPKREQTKQEIIQEYQKHQEAFAYVKEYFIANDISQIRKDSGNIIIQNASEIVSFEDMNDELLIKYVHLLFDDFHYSIIYRSYTCKESVIQLIFEKETNKQYFTEIVYCRDNEPPVSTSSLFFNVEQIDNYWFYCEDNQDEDLF